MTVEEASEALGISARTADNYWDHARAWLSRIQSPPMSAVGGPSPPSVFCRPFSALCPQADDY
jgi:hypothetical protein